MVKCVACLKNEANPKNFERFHHFYCDECVKRATAEAAEEGNKDKLIKAQHVEIARLRKMLEDEGIDPDES